MSSFKVDIKFSGMRICQEDKSFFSILKFLLFLQIILKLVYLDDWTVSILPISYDLLLFH